MFQLYRGGQSYWCRKPPTYCKSLTKFTVKNTMLIYVHSFRFRHIYVYNLIKLYNMPEVDKTISTRALYETGMNVHK
jgi:hypothetical protein